MSDSMYLIFRIYVCLRFYAQLRNYDVSHICITELARNSVEKYVKATRQVTFPISSKVLARLDRLLVSHFLMDNQLSTYVTV